MPQYTLPPHTASCSFCVRVLISICNESTKAARSLASVYRGKQGCGRENQKENRVQIAWNSYVLSINEWFANGNCHGQTIPTVHSWLAFYWQLQHITALFECYQGIFSVLSLLLRSLHVCLQIFRPSNTESKLVIFWLLKQTLSTAIATHTQLLSTQKYPRLV